MVTPKSKRQPVYNKLITAKRMQKMLKQQVLEEQVMWEFGIPQNTRQLVKYLRQVRIQMARK